MKKTLTWLAMLLIVPLLAVIGTASSASALSCTNGGSLTGDMYTGSWTKHYCANNGNNIGLITVSWNSWKDTTNFDRHTSYNMTVQTDALAGNNCIYVALDWAPINASHSDAQIMRNCYPGSVESMSTQFINLDSYCPSSYCSAALWYTWRLQAGIYDPSDAGTNAAVSGNHRDCPGTQIPGTDTSAECDNWFPSAVFSSVGAKIRRNSTGSEQNDPQYPDFYDVRDIISPNM